MWELELTSAVNVIFVKSVPGRTRRAGHGGGRLIRRRAHVRKGRGVQHPCWLFAAL